MKVKKILSLVLAAALLCAVLIVSAGAAYGFPDIREDADYGWAVEYTAELGIFKGDDHGRFNPKNSITRAEFAAVVCRLMGKEAEAVAPAVPDFDDVPVTGWAAGYISWAVKNGMVNGYGDGRYGPSDPVTCEQAVKIVMCAVGLKEASEAAGGWSAGYMAVAGEVGALSGVRCERKAPLPRCYAAVLLANSADVTGDGMKYSLYLTYGGGHVVGTFDSAGRVIRRDYYDAFGTFTDCTTYEIGANGLKSSENYYLGDGTPNGSGTFEYDANGNMTVEVYSYPNKELNSKYVNSYDADGNLTACIAYDADGNIEWRSAAAYDERGNELEYIFYNASGNADWRYTCAYDENNNRTEYIGYDENGSIYTHTAYVFDENDRELEYISYDENGNILSRTTSTYDGGTVKQTSYGSDGIPLYISEYNERGNVVRTDCYSDGALYSTDLFDGEGRAVYSAYYEYGEISWYSETEYGDNTVTTREYDADGRLYMYTADRYADGLLLRSDAYDEYGSLKYTWEYDYNDMGNSAVSTRRNPDGKIAEQVIREYYSDGETLKTVSYFSYGFMWSRELYNGDGMLIADEYYDEDSGTLFYIDSYDDDGSWLNRTFYNTDGSVDRISETRD